MDVKIIQGNLVEFEGDAIVNAANVRLLGGGGVDGAIHKAAGRHLFHACKELPEVEPGVRCPTGEARITRGYDLPARLVIHTVGPIFPGAKVLQARNKYDTEVPSESEAEAKGVLVRCLRSVMNLADQYNVKTIAFPAISCGVFGCPLEVFARMAHMVLYGTDDTISTVEEITFILFLDDEYALFRETWG